MFAKEETGRAWRADFGYIRQHILIEVEGGIYSGGRHVTGNGYNNDCIKYNWAALLGWCLIRVTAPMIRSGEALDFIEEALKRC